MYQSGGTKVELHSEVTPEVLIQNDARWHDSCRREFEQSRVTAAIKRFFKKDKETNESELTIWPSKQRSVDLDNCLFCECPAGKKSFRNFTNLETSDKVKQMAKDLQDTDLMVRVDGPDLVAMKAKYHLSCLAEVQNRHRSYLAKQKMNSNEEKTLEARALTELIGHVEDGVEAGQYFFKLQELHAS